MTDWLWPFWCVVKTLLFKSLLKVLLVLKGEEIRHVEEYEKQTYVSTKIESYPPGSVKPWIYV
jgi:hypothetical protein